MFRPRAEKLLVGLLWCLASAAAAILVLIALFLLRETLPLLTRIGPARFFADPAWRPTVGQFNMTPMLLGTLAATGLAMLLAAPLGVASAVFCQFHAPRRIAGPYRRMIELLAGVPSVVYGFWGLVVLVPLIGSWRPPGVSLLAGGLILALMILPTVARLTEVSLARASREYLRAAAGLGLSRRATIVNVALPAARSGVFTALLLATARALGETMAVLMVCGNVVQTPRGLFEPLRTLTANIALEMAYATGDHRAALFASGLVLLLLVAALVALAEAISRRRSGASRPSGGRGSRRANSGEGEQGRVGEGGDGRRGDANFGHSPPHPLASSPSPKSSAGASPSRWRFGLLDKTFDAGVWLAATCVAAALGWLLGDVLRHGLGVVSWEFLTAPPLDAGRAGGIAPVLVSTLLILLVCAAATAPLGLGTAMLLAEFTSVESRGGRLVRRSLDVLAGVPSIVFGLFGNAFFCQLLGLRFSILSGGLTLACMALPLVIRASEEGFRAVPDEYRRAAASLGFSRASVALRVALPPALPGVLAGLVLGVGRALAETAALIFTAGYVDRMPRSLWDSGRALSVHIYDLSMNVPGGTAAAYGSAAVLVALLLLINLSASGLLRCFAPR